LLNYGSVAILAGYKLAGVLHRIRELLFIILMVPPQSALNVANGFEKLDSLPAQNVEEEIENGVGDEDYCCNSR
jgi:hypothetical protein